MAQKKKQSKKQEPQELEGVFFLKLMLYVLVGSLWFKGAFGTDVRIDLPIGLIVGLVFASHEHFRIDRKIEYAVLVVAMLLGYIAPFGLYVTF